MTWLVDLSAGAFPFIAIAYFAAGGVARRRRKKSGSLRKFPKSSSAAGVCSLPVSQSVSFCPLLLFGRRRPNGRMVNGLTFYTIRGIRGHAWLIGRCFKTSWSPFERNLSELVPLLSNQLLAFVWKLSFSFSSFRVSETSICWVTHVRVRGLEMEYFSYPFQTGCVLCDSFFHHFEANWH